MRAASPLFAAIVFAATSAATANAETIAPGASYSQDFDSLGSSATASLPSGWSATASTSIRAVTSTEYSAAGTATTQQGTGSGTSGGIYNWGESTNTTDRGVGFLATGSATKTGNLYFSLTADGYIPDFTVSYDVKCYRNNSRQYQFQLYYSTDDGSTWTSAGGDFLTQPATNSSAYYATPGVTSVASKTLDVSLTAGKTVILCWSYSVSSGTQTSNAQGLGIDNVVIVAGQSSGLDPLAAPTFEPVYPEDATADGFVVRWMAVENAVGYDLVVTNVADRMEAGGQVSYSGPFPPDNLLVTATVTGLDADTLYAVAARALATTDPSFPSTDYSDSAWSAPVEIATTLEGGLLRATLFDETFDNIAMTSATAWNASGAIQDTDEPDWTFASNAIRAPMGMRLGTANNPGSATTREIAVSNDLASTTVTLSFLAASYTGKITSGSVTVIDATTGAETEVLSLDPSPMANGVKEPLSGGTAYNETITVPSRFALRFESLSSGTDKRLLLDSIQVTQVYDPNFAVLAAPTGVAGSDVGKHGFTVSWTGVSNATGYEVWLNGAVAGSCALTDTSMDLTGLSDGTTYSVQVKALGDNLHFGDSPLSTAVSVTTLADAQKIDFTVTGAPAGDVFAGDAVSFTVTAENEATHAAEPVSFSGIAGATFTAATGAFSWTPTEGDVGSHTATFASGDYSTNVTITVVSALKTETLAAEYFSEIKSTSWTSTSGYASELEGDMGPWTGHDIIKTKAAVIIGRRTSSGNIVSPAVELKVRTPGSLSVSFDTGSLPDATASVKASILDAADGRVLFEQTFASLSSLPSDATAVSDAGAHFTLAPDASVALPAEVKVKFETIESAGDNSQRAYVDTVVFEQKISARIPDLPAPTGLAVVEGSVETNGFSVAWSAVSGATNYAVRVTDSSGAVVFSAPFCASAPVAVTGLADDEAYAVQVRATGDEAICFASPWSNALAVRTARSATHPTLSFGAWQNAAGDGKVYGGLLNTAAVSAVRDNGTNAVVTLASVLPAPAVGPTLEGGVLSWIPDDADTNKTFTISFLMDGTYATNLSFKVLSIAPLAPPTVTAGPVAWDAFGLAWDPQYRAAGYAVRVWTDCPNPGATATRVEEDFAGWPAARPSWWSYHTLAGGYKDAAAPVSFDATGDELKTYDLGGPISSVSFHAAGHSIAGSSSALTVVGIAADGAETVLGTLTAAEIGQSETGVDWTFAIPEGADVRRIAWRYTKDGGGVGVGSVVIEGTGFATPRWLPGWGPAAKDVGLAQVCTVKKPRPGKALGPDPADKKEDLFEPRVNYAEVAARDAAGATLATVVAVKVPAPPRSVRATMLITR